MFRRLESGLPKDPIYPADLQGLGYFINEKDEIRLIENPKAYFKFFLTKNDRYNCVQRESMNEVIRNLVYERLEKLGLQKIRLPLGVKENEPNLPIFTSSDLDTKKRVIILFYEHTQDLGIFAHRILGGKGGINTGSAVNFVKYIQSLKTSPEDADSPGIILANMGQLRWWRRGSKAITQTSWFALPQKSAVDAPYRFDEDKNTIPGNRSTSEHVNYIFNRVVEEMVDPAALIDIVGVSEGAFQVSTFLNDPENWEKWSSRVSAFAAVATYFQATDIKNEKFAKWYKKRGRAYLASNDPCGTYLARPEGNRCVAAHGCPAFSLGEPYYSEAMLPKGYKTVIDWFHEVSAHPEYENPEFIRTDEIDDEDGESVEHEGGVGLTPALEAS